MLLDYGANITVCAMELEQGMERLIEQYGETRVHFIQLQLQKNEGWKKQLQEKGELAFSKFVLVICATNQKQLNEEIALFCKREGILVNVADNQELCSFFFPSVVRRGPISIGISTSGKSPMIAKQLRKKIELLVLEEDLERLEEIGEYRKKLKQEIKDEAKRRVYNENFVFHGHEMDRN